MENGELKCTLGGELILDVRRRQELGQRIADALVGETAYAAIDALEAARRIIQERAVVAVRNDGTASR